MQNNDKLHDCANLYTELKKYEYKINLYSSGKIIDTTICFDESNFMHLAGLEKLTDSPVFTDISSNRLYTDIKNHNISYQDACNSSLWNNPLNDPEKNGVVYTLDDRIDTLTNFHDILNNNPAKAYSWNPDCHYSYRPYNSKISADFMLVFEPQNKKTVDEKIYAFFRFDKNNPKIAHGVSQFPTDRTYNNDGHRSVPEITLMSLIEHDKVNNVDKVIFALSDEEKQRLHKQSELRAINTVVAKDLRQLKSKRYKYFQSKTESAQNAYNRKLEIFGSNSPYTVEMLKEAADRLAEQAQDPHNRDVKDLIVKEVEHIGTEIARRERNSEISSGITIMKSVRNNNGSVSLTKPIVTVDTPKFITKATSQIRRVLHFISVSAADIFSDIKDSLTGASSEQNKKVPKKETSKSQPVKREPVRTAKHEPVGKQDRSRSEDNVPLFSISEIKSDKYTPTSSKDKRDKTKNKDLDL